MSSPSAGIAPLDGLDLVGQGRHEVVVHGRPGDDPGRRRAVLAGVPVAGEAQRLRGEVHVGVIEDDDRRLAAELQVEALDRLRRDPGDALAGHRVAGDGDHAHLGMADQRVTDVAACAGQHVHHARGQDLGQDLGEGERRERGPSRWLEDDRVARGEGRPELPAGHVQRVVPGRDRGDDTDRVAADDRGVAGRELVGRKAVHDPSRAGEEAEQVGAHGDLVDGGADRLAGVRALQPAELVGPRIERVGDLEEQQRAILRGRLLPRRERRLGRVDRPIHVLGGARRDARDGLVVGRVHDLGRAPVGGIHELAADELLIRLDALEGVGHG